MKRAVLFTLLCIILCFAQNGRISRAGYTTSDCWFSVPIHKWCITDSVANGIYICWNYSNFTSYYVYAYHNFFSFTNFNWYLPNGCPFTDGMFRSIDNHPITGCVYIMVDNMVGHEIALGSGLYDFFAIPNNLGVPIIAVTPDSVVHFLYTDNIDYDTLLYLRRTDNGIWSSPIHISTPASEPMWHSHNFASSKISNKLIAVWLCYVETVQTYLFYHISNNSGLTWETPVELPYPPTNIASPTFDDFSLYAMFDAQDNFHIVTAITEHGYTIPAEIWHFCPVNNPQWNLVFHYDAETLAATVGYDAIFADRPTIVQNHRDNYLYMAWEQFDSLNYEPSTSLARADVMIAESPNNGLTWQNQRPITTPNTTSKRFPCAGGVDHDTLTVAYLIDSIAGTYLFAQGRATYNPVVIQRIKVPLSGVGCEYISNIPINKELVIYPNPARTYFNIHLSKATEYVKFYDVTGKAIKELKGLGIGDWRIPLNGIKNGIYFVKLGNETKKIIVNK